MDLTELYQSLILDHNRSPRNSGELAGANRVADGRNPMCGDQLRVWLKVDGRPHRRRHLRRQGLRDLAGVGVADDDSREGEDAAPKRS